MARVDETVADAGRQLTAVNLATARLDATLLVADAMGQSKEWLLAHPEAELSAEAQQRAQKTITRRAAREPLAYIRGWQEFYGRRFAVNPVVLIPRPESEAIIAIIKESMPAAGTRLLDVGTGSGCLAITAALEFPELRVTGLDISPAALRVAQQNAADLHAKVDFIKSDLLHNAAAADIIVANLPYVDHAWQRSPETSYEPPLALFAQEGGLRLIKKLLAQASALPQRVNRLILEADPRQHTAIQHFAALHGFATRQVEGFILELTPAR